MTAAPIFSTGIRRSESDEVRVTLEAQRGAVVVDVRVWEDQKFGAVTSRGPTKKGATLPLASLPQLLAALNGAAREATLAGLIEIKLAASIDGECASSSPKSATPHSGDAVATERTTAFAFSGKSPHQKPKGVSCVQRSGPGSLSAGPSRLTTVPEPVGASKPS